MILQREIVEWSTFEEYDDYLKLNYGKCSECSKQMHNARLIHTFECECGHRVWYAERYYDSRKVN